MRKTMLSLSAVVALFQPLAAPPVLAQASASLAAGQTQPSPLAPSEIVAAAPEADWTAIAPSDLLVLDLAPAASSTAPGSVPRRVVIQLMPAPFSQRWIGNIRRLAAARFWDGLSINRVQDNYVVQWGDADAEDRAKARALPPGLATVPEQDYTTPTGDGPGSIRFALVQASIFQIANAVGAAARKARSAGEDKIAYVPVPGDHYAAVTTHWQGWPIAGDEDGKAAWPVHCYGMVGVGRDLSPNTGSGAELYVVIGHAPRHLDRNIALIGRVIEGIEHLSGLPRGTGGLGFYETAAERTAILSIRNGNDVSGLPAYEYLSTQSESFARYADARANRRDPFFIRPAGGADICNIPVPVRRSPGAR